MDRVTAFETVNSAQSISTADHAGSVLVKEKSGFASLLFSMFKIGLIGFGGGTALIPVIEEEVVYEQGLVSKKDYDENVVSACVTPGALPVEVAAGIGQKTYGLKGMISAAVLMALPGALLTVVILSLLSNSSLNTLNAIQYISIGLGGFISSLLAGYSIKTVKEAGRRDKKDLVISLIILAAVFAMTGLKSLFSLLGFDTLSDAFFKLSTFKVLMISFAVMIVIYLFRYLKDRSAAAHTDIRTDGSRHSGTDRTSIIRESAAWLIFAAVLALPAIIVLDNGVRYILRGFASSFISFGGGDAYLSVADGLFVNSGFVSENDFYGLLVPVANVLPGSILCKILTGVGYLIGASEGGQAAGTAGALAGFAVSVAASGLVFGIVYFLFRTFENVSFFRFISKWIRPIISGLLLGVMVTMFKTNAATAEALGRNTAAALIITAVITVSDLVIINKKKTGNLLPMIVSAAAGLLLLAF